MTSSIRESHDWIRTRDRRYIDAENTGPFSGDREISMTVATERESALTSVRRKGPIPNKVNTTCIERKITATPIVSMKGGPLHTPDRFQRVAAGHIESSFGLFFNSWQGTRIGIVRSAYSDLHIGCEVT